MKENKDYSIFLFWSAVIISIIILFLSVCKDKVFADDLIGTDLSSLQEYYEYPVTCNVDGHGGYEDLGMRCFEADSMITIDDFDKKYPFLCISVVSNDLEGYVFFTSAKTPSNGNGLKYAYAHSWENEDFPYIHILGGRGWSDKNNCFFVSWSNEWLQSNKKPFNVVTPYKVLYDGNLLDSNGFVGTAVSDFVGRLHKGNFIVKNTEELGSENNPKYSDNIGYLQITKAKFTQNKADNVFPSWVEKLASALNGGVLESTNNRVISRSLWNNYWAGSYYTAWKNQTSQGFSLNNPPNGYTGVYIQWQAENRFKIGGVKSSTYGQKGTLHSVRNEGEIFIKPTDLVSEFPELFAELEKALGFTGVFYDSTLDMDFRIYYRPVFCKNGLSVIPDSSTGNEWIRGSWKYVDFDFTDVSNGVIPNNGGGDYDDEGNWLEDDEAPYDDISSGTVKGDSIDDILDKIENPEMDFSNYIENITLLTEQVKVIPSIIGDLLSFLPSWVITLIALSIGTLCVLMVIKFIRG